MCRLMIVDDEDLTRKALYFLIKNNLPEISFICEAPNGDEAIEVARNAKLDIVLMDIKMPGKNGLLVTQEIKEMNPSIKVIMITAFDNFDFAQKALKLWSLTP